MPILTGLFVAPILLNLYCPVSLAQDTPATQDTPAPPNSTEALLPRFDLRAEKSETLLREGNPVSRLSNIVLDWGDLHIEAETLILDFVRRQHEFTGRVRIRRGDEEIEGASVVLDEVAGTMDVRQARVATPPYYLLGERVLRGPDSLTAQNTTVALDPQGRGEVRFRASEIQLLNSNRLTLRNPTLYLFGTKLFRLRSVSLPVTLDPGYGGTGRSTAPPPVTARISQISGYAFGVGGNFTPFAGIIAGAILEYSTRQGVQYNLTAQRTLIGPRRADQNRQLVGRAGGVETGLAPEERAARPRPSPLRQLLTARPLPPPRDPVLDFMDILFTDDPLARPTQVPPRNLALQVTLGGNREFAGRRQGPLLLSRLPEIGVIGQVPLFSPRNVQDNATARRALRTPRPVLTGEVSLGRYEETRLDSSETVRRNVTEQRNNFIIGLSTLPVLVGERILVLSEINHRENFYGNGEVYRFTEASVAGAVIFGTRQMIGGSYIRRITDGSTPFFFDQVDTQNEAQVRAQTTLLRQKYTLAALGRYDLAQRRFFDTEIAVGIRGVVIEPRFSYRTLNRQFNFNIAFPTLTP